VDVSRLAIRAALAGLCVLGCGEPAPVVSASVLLSPLPRPAPAPAPPPAPDPVPAAAGRWIVGDMHVHVSPPDAEGDGTYTHSTYTVDKLIDAARRQNLDFVVVTPHDADRSFPSPSGPSRGPVWGQELVEIEAARALAAPSPTGVAPRPLLVVSGWEFTRENPGHVGMSFFRMDDVAQAVGDKKMEVAAAKGGLVVVNHPFFRPVKSDNPLMRLVEGDRTWRPFLDGTDARLWNAIEIWHQHSVMVQKMHVKSADRFPETQMVSDAIRAWEKATLETKRRLVAVGGTDVHGRLPYAMAPAAMVGVRVESFDVESLHRALLAAHVTFGAKGGLAAGDFAAASDVAGARAVVGDSLAARSEVRLSWSGPATLYENGAKVGDFVGGTSRRVEPAGSFRFWRIEKPGDAYSNMIYANLP
jgi:hypothetical protein